MKKTWFLILLTVSCASLYAQEDVVVMRVNGQPVTRSEFEYFYNKNNSESVIDKKSVEEYAQLYADYKLKVLAAKDAQQFPKGVSQLPRPADSSLADSCWSCGQPLSQLLRSYS